MGVTNSFIKVLATSCKRFLKEEYLEREKVAMTTTAPHLESILRPTKLAIVLFAISNAGLSEYMGTVGNLSLAKFIAPFDSCLSARLHIRRFYQVED